jgi:predicted ATPase/signal transduction histidine kinase
MDAPADTPAFPITPSDDDYAWELLRRDGVLAHFRGRHLNGADTVLLTLAASAQDEAQAAPRLNREFVLRERLDPASAVVPLARVWRHGSLALVYADHGAAPLDQRRAGAVDIDTFLSLAAGIAAALRCVHDAGLLHRDVRPANILVDADGLCRLGGFGLTGESSTASAPTFAAPVFYAIHASAEAFGAPAAEALPYMSPEHTGRSAGPLDARSDLYSLGVTLYELLTGRLPFLADQGGEGAVGEWIHHHLASEPAAPHDMLPGVPPPLSSLVLKLLAKDPARRYQSTAGLEADLKRCATAWQASGRIDQFQLGLHEQGGGLAFPAQLLAREAPLQSLLDALRAVCRGGSQAVAVVGGPPGIGRSALLAALLEKLHGQRVCVAVARAHAQPPRPDLGPMPYAPLVDALRTLVLQILGQSEAELAYWKQHLGHALGPHLKLALGLLPELDLLAGRMPMVAAAEDLRQRDGEASLRAVMYSLVSAFASAERPLVLLIDDVQWLDAASLDLLESLVGGTGVPPLLLVMASRDREAKADAKADGDAAPDVGGQRWFGRTLPVLRMRAAHYVAIDLPALPLSALERLIAGALRITRRQGAGLAALVLEKTAGNPFFAKQFIGTMFGHGLIARGARDGRWHWDLAAMRTRGHAANVAGRVLSDLARLPESSRAVLGALACLDRHATLSRLCAMVSMEQSAVRQVLAPAVAARVLRIEGEIPAFIDAQVRTAAWAAVAQDGQAAWHLAAGRLLAAELLAAGVFASGASADQSAVAGPSIAAAVDDDGGLEFGAVGHLALAQSLAQSLVIAPEERLAYARLGLLAARKAGRNGAYGPALAHLETARGFMSGAAPADTGDLAHAIGFEAARYEFLSGKLAAALALATALPAPAGLPERAAIWRLQAEIHLRRGDPTLAVGTALAGLRHFGIVLTPHPDRAQSEALYGQLSAALDAFDDTGAVLRRLPALGDRGIGAAMALLSVLALAAAGWDEELQLAALCHLLDLTLRHGLGAPSAAALAGYALLLARRYARHVDAARYGALARALAARHVPGASEAGTLLPFAQLGVWTQPIGRAVDCAGAAFSAAVIEGDPTLACHACRDQVCYMLARGDHLDAVAAEIARGIAFVGQADFGEVSAMLEQSRDLVDILRGPQSGSPHGQPYVEPDGQPFSGLTLAPRQDGDGTASGPLLFCSWLYKAIMHYLAGEYDHAAASIEQAGLSLAYAPVQLQLVDYHFFSGLIAAAPALAPQRQAQRRALFVGHQERIAGWAALYPGTCGHKAVLLQGELRRLDGEPFVALGLYETAIRLAREQGFGLCVAIGHELAARACRAWGHDTAACGHARSAHDAWRRWGAMAMAGRIERAYPELAAGRMAAAAISGPAGAVDTAEIRDIDSVIRSARALSEEICVDELVHTLMTIALEYAGAQRGLLLRMRGGVPLIEACARTTPAGIEVELMQTTPGRDDLPDTLLYTAVRTRQRVAIADARSTGPYQLDPRDPYLLRHPRCAALCIPMLKQSELVGLLYLENRLAPQAFSGEQTRVLELLAAQAAVSLETARLYAELLDENVERRRVEQALRASEASLAMGEQISHTGSWRWKLEQNLLVCSAEFCRLFDIDPADPVISFHQFIEHLHPDDRQRVRQLATACVAEGRPMWGEFRTRAADGAVRYLSAAGKPALDGADPAGEGADGEGGRLHDYVGTVTDITMRRAAEDTLRGAQSDLARVARATTVGQLTASIAHEINQPLMSIATNAGASLRWLDRDPPRLDQVRAGLRDIASESRRAGDMIQSLQALTRNVPPAFAALDLHDTIRHILFISRNELERRQVGLDLALEAASSLVLGDSVQLQQVLLNLVINAVEAMSEVPDRPRLMSISSALLAPTRDEAGHIRVAIDDTGIGLDEAGATRIFEAFYTTKKNGMGMGLAICRSIIEIHHGQMGAMPRPAASGEREEQGGSRFWFELPLIEAAP